MALFDLANAFGWGPADLDLLTQTEVNFLVSKLNQRGSKRASREANGKVSREQFTSK